MTPLYTAEATAIAGRDGKVKTSDGKIDLALSLPKELGGPGGAGTNPEQLFAAGYAACFGSALKMIAGQKKVAVTEVKVTAKVHIGKQDPVFGLAAELQVSLSGVDRAQAESLVNAAHDVCPYSLAVKKSMNVKLTVI
jgi:osmotically inducible protein OsmC